MQNRIEESILKNLFTSDNFTRKVLPYLEEDYFTDRSERLVYKQITEYFMKYNECPTHEALNIQLNDLSGHNDEEIKNAQNIINACKENSEETNLYFHILFRLLSLLSAEKMFTETLCSQ